MFPRKVVLLLVAVVSLLFVMMLQHQPSHTSDELDIDRATKPEDAAFNDGETKGMEKRIKIASDKNTHQLLADQGRTVKSTAENSPSLPIVVAHETAASHFPDSHHPAATVQLRPPIKNDNATAGIIATTSQHTSARAKPTLQEPSATSVTEKWKERSPSASSPTSKESNNSDHCSSLAIADCLEVPSCMVQHPELVVKAAINSTGPFRGAAALGLLDSPLNERQCVANPFVVSLPRLPHTTSASTALTDPDVHLTCPGLLHPVPLEDRCPHEPQASRDDLSRFKCLTSWMFPHWYQWRAEPSMSSAADPTERTKVIADEKNHGVLTVENGCMTPHGLLSGWKPQLISPYLGQMETKGGFENAGGQFAREMFKRFDSLSEPPTTLFNTKVVLMPLTGSAINVAHMMHRAVGVNELIRIVYGDASLDFDAEDTLVVFVVTNTSRGEMAGRMGAKNAFSLYQGVMGSGRWAVIFSSNVTDEDVKWWHQLHNFEHVAAKFASEPSPRVCFKKTIVYENCNSICGRDSHPPWEWSVFTERLDRHRHMSQRFRNKVGKCLSEDPLKKVVSTSPSASTPRRVFYSYRTQTRRPSDFNYILQPLAAYVKGTLKADHFAVQEAFSTPTNDLFRNILNADVFIGTHGAQFMLANLLPIGAIVFEITIPYYSDPHHGQNWHTSVFGASYHGANVRNAAVVLENDIVRYRTAHLFHTDFEVSLDFYFVLVDKIAKLLDEPPALSVSAEEEAHLYHRRDSSVLQFRNVTALAVQSQLDLKDEKAVRLKMLAKMYHRVKESPSTLSVKPATRTTTVADDLLSSNDEFMFNCVHRLMLSARNKGHHFRTVEIHLMKEGNEELPSEASNERQGSTQTIQTDRGPSMWRGLMEGYFVRSGWLQLETTERTKAGLVKLARFSCASIKGGEGALLKGAPKCLVVVHNPHNISIEGGSLQPTASQAETSGKRRTCFDSQMSFLVLLRSDLP